jgi:hypothetical protein
MNHTTVQPRPESWLRRAWRGFYATLQAMETSGYEHLDDRLIALDKRIRKLEAMQDKAQDK